jgi:hypothetical protein
VSIVALGERLTHHPAYMAVAHIPTALWLASSLFDLLALVTRGNIFVRLAHLAQSIGVAGTVVLHLLRPAPEPAHGLAPADREVAHLHREINAALPVIYGLSAGLRSGPALARQRPATLPLLLSLLGCAGLFASRGLAKQRAALIGIDLAAAASPDLPAPASPTAS